MQLVKNKSFFYLVLLCVLSVLTVLPFFYNGFFTMHDNTQVARVSEMSLSLRDGMIPVRWVMNLGYGYGYPIFTFYAPFAYYIGAFWMTFGLDALVATKLMMMSGVILAGMFMYLFAKDIWGEEGGFVAALFYLFAPYHAVNIYVRGAVAEFWGMAFLPLLFYGIWNTYKTGKWRYVCISSIAYAGIILSHNLTAMMVTPFVLVVIGGMKIMYLSRKEYKKILPLGILLILGITLSAFYWLPAVTEMKYTNVVSQITGTGSKFGDHFVCMNQLWDSAWGYAGSAPGCVDGISFRIGKLHILFTIIGIILGIFIYKKNREKGIILGGSILFFFAATFLTLQNSELLWKSISAMSYFQFPWRFLLLVVFFSSFISGGVIWYVREYLQNQRILFYAFLIGVMLGCILLYSKLFVPQLLTQDTAKSLTDSKSIRFTISKISDEYMPKNFHKPLTESDVVTEKSAIINGQGTINEQPILSYAQGYSVEAITPVTLLLRTAPFPAWRTYIDGKEVPHTNLTSGMKVVVPIGTHMVSAQYISTWIEMTGNLITLTSMLGLVIGIIYLHKKNML